MPAFVDLKNCKIGRLTVIERAPSYRDRFNKLVTMWQCICECGNEITTHSQSLRKGHTKSCGCLNTETRSRLIKQRSITHGETIGGKTTGEHNSWSAMKQRCLNPNCKKYPIYGGRGITICKRWLKYENFLADMGRRPHPKMQIDRIDNNGNYEPSNCKWSMPVEQSNNRSFSRHYEYNGERLTIRGWSNRTGFCYSTIANRLKSGWTMEKVINHPKRDWGGGKKRTGDTEGNPNPSV